MEDEIPDGLYSTSRSEYFGGLAISAAIGVPLIYLGISGFIPDEYGVTMPVFGSLMLLFGIASAAFLKAMIERKVIKSNGILRTKNPLFMLNQCFDLQRIKEYRYKRVYGSYFSLEILYKEKWKLVMGNTAFLKQLPPNKTS